MPKQHIPLLLAALLPATAAATPGPPTPADPGQLCDAAIASADRRHAFPPGLLHAIGLAESGRRNPETGIPAPWPWTIDVDGAGHFYPTEAAAIAAAQGFLAQGHRSIDIGCLQVNLAWHPNAFPSLAAAFDPATNAAYGAAYLDSLHAAGAGWMQAAGEYHSFSPGPAAVYRARVAALLGGGTVPPVAAWPVVVAAATPWPPRPAGTLRGTILRPPPPQSPLLAAGRAIGGLLTGRSLAVYRAAPVWRRD